MNEEGKVKAINILDYTVDQLCNGIVNKQPIKRQYTQKELIKAMNSIGHHKRIYASGREEYY